jgi:hypothetical protein
MCSIAIAAIGRRDQSEYLVTIIRCPQCCQDCTRIHQPRKLKPGIQHDGADIIN